MSALPLKADAIADLPTCLFGANNGHKRGYRTSSGFSCQVKRFVQFSDSFGELLTMHDVVFWNATNRRGNIAQNIS